MSSQIESKNRSKSVTVTPCSPCAAHTATDSRRRLHASLRRRSSSSTPRSALSLAHDLIPFSPGAFSSSSFLALPPPVRAEQSAAAGVAPAFPRRPAAIPHALGRLTSPRTCSTPSRTGPSPARVPRGAAARHCRLLHPARSGEPTSGPPRPQSTPKIAFPWCREACRFPPRRLEL